MSGTCTFGGYRQEGTTRRPNFCGRPAVASSALGLPRCEAHQAHFYMVSVGTSLTRTRRMHDAAHEACAEILDRIPIHMRPASSGRDFERMHAWPATDSDLALFGELVEQDRPDARRRLIATGKRP